jgi:hypothetical protein
MYAPHFVMGIAFAWRLKANFAGMLAGECGTWSEVESNVEKARSMSSVAGRTGSSIELTAAVDDAAGATTAAVCKACGMPLEAGQPTCPGCGSKS